MKEQIVFEKEEFNNLYLKFINNVMEDMKKDYGFKIIAKDTGEEISKLAQLGGTFLMAWNNTFTNKD